MRRISLILFAASLASSRSFTMTARNFALPVTAITSQGGAKSPFPSVFREYEHDEGFLPKTKKELNVMRLLGSIRGKPKWWEKVFDESITSKWRDEAGTVIEEAEFDFAVKELREVSSQLVKSSSGPIEVEGAFGADGLIDEALKTELKEALRPFETVPDEDKDWHPNTNQQVLNLIHPSMYCAVSEFSHDVKEESIPRKEALNWMGRGEPVVFRDMGGILRPDTEPQYYSGKFQWLPSDVRVSDDGASVEFLSYINNVHPERHEATYAVLERVLARLLPLFESTLTCMLAAAHLPDRTQVDMYDLRQDRDDSRDHDDDNEDDDEQPPVTKFPSLVEFGPFRDKYLAEVREREFLLRGRRLQVIVKAANILLTPDKPEYPGGTWHVEGMANEAIIATGIYYYDVENIGESRLAFRVACAECEYEQNDDAGVEAIYGLTNEGPLSQVLGSVEARQDRCITFPNVYQHQVLPFELADRTKPGHRKILVFFLVDPTVTVLSTSRVPPQQSDWYAEVLSQELQSKLPQDVAAKTAAMGCGTFTMSREQAEKHREELMAERSLFVNDQNEEVFERPFSLCEH